VIAVAILLVIAGSLLATVVPTLPTADAVAAVVFAVFFLGLVIWVLRSGGGFGGWGDSGRMGN
jgi:uncharacterized membrane protein